MRARWVFAVIAGLIVLGVAFLLTGGVYRTVNAGDGNVLLVNRFTGSSRSLTAPAPTTVTDSQDRVKAHILDMASEANARGLRIVGDRSTNLFHDVYSNSLALILWDPSTSEEPGGDWLSDVCYSLKGTTSPQYFQNTLEAFTEGFWPCSRCYPSKWRYVIAKRAKVRLWPDDSALMDFPVQRGDRVEVLSRHGDWAAVTTQRIATGKRGVGWLRWSQLYPGETGWASGKDKAYVLRWAADADEAHHLRNTGKGPATIATGKGWSQAYVESLLEANILAE